MITDSLLLTYYGDDFTGSTDVMEALTLNGIPAALFLDVPTPAQLGAFAGLQAIGIAGVSRSMTPAQMDAELPRIFEALRSFGAPIVHYKICSTFDSAPEIGSIGHTIDIGSRIFNPPVIPLAVGAPVLRRYVAFGNLFATVGGDTYRLDRHPTMSKHPIKPINESDLRLHLGRQTTRRIGLVDLLHLAQPDDALDAHFRQLARDGAEIVLFDTVDETHLLKIGRLIWSQTGDKPLFVVGSSGVEYALAAYLQAAGIVAKPPPLPSPGRVDQLLVISGSASPVTAEQIDYAAQQGFHRLRLDSARLVDPACAGAERAAALERALAILGAGHSLILYSTHGSDDPAIEATNERLRALGLDARSVGQRLGAQQGLLLRDLLLKTGLKRVCVAGGDTCGHASRQLGIYALEALMPIAPGAPLCRARSNEFAGLEISLKGGQNGRADYFVKILNGG